MVGRAHTKFLHEVCATWGFCKPARRKPGIWCEEAVVLGTFFVDSGRDLGKRYVGRPEPAEAPKWFPGGGSQT